MEKGGSGCALLARQLLPPKPGCRLEWRKSDPEKDRVRLCNQLLEVRCRTRPSRSLAACCKDTERGMKDPDDVAVVNESVRPEIAHGFEELKRRPLGNCLVCCSFSLCHGSTLPAKADPRLGISGFEPRASAHTAKEKSSTNSSPPVIGLQLPRGTFRVLKMLLRRRRRGAAREPGRAASA